MLYGMGVLGVFEQGGLFSPHGVRTRLLFSTKPDPKGISITKSPQTNRLRGWSRFLKVPFCPTYHAGKVLENGNLREDIDMNEIIKRKEAFPSCRLEFGAYFATRRSRSLLGGLVGFSCCISRRWVYDGWFSLMSRIFTIIFWHVKGTRNSEPRFRRQK